MTVYSTAFLPSVLYVSEFFKSTERIIDTGENFIKQTHRNRCTMLSANGPQNLVIPVQKSESRHVRDIKISYSDNWQRKYTQAIVSAYKNTPYYEHYEEDFLSAFLCKEDFLADYNEQLMQWIWKQLGQIPNYAICTDYIENPPEDMRPVDFCGEFPSRKFIPYKQVFSSRFGFISNLSIIDLIFNKGPEAPLFLGMIEHNRYRK